MGGAAEVGGCVRAFTVVLEELALLVRVPCGGDGGWDGGEIQVVEDFRDGGSCGDEGQQHHLGLAPGTPIAIDAERAAEHEEVEVAPVQPHFGRIEKRLKSRYCDEVVEDLDTAMNRVRQCLATGEARSIALLGNAADVIPAIAAGDLLPDICTDQTKWYLQ